MCSTNIEIFNRKCVLKLKKPLHGMIDAHAYHSGLDTWSPGLVYVDSTGELRSLEDIVLPSTLLQEMFTVELGCVFVVGNTKMYNSNKGTLRSLGIDEVPSLIINSTSDMEFAHLDGYEGKIIQCDESKAFSGWAKQIEDTEMAVSLNPLRLFPLFSYDPRRYRLPDAKYPGCSFCEKWDRPFERVVGCGDNGIWLGFCMNPSLGFRPFDELCENLEAFYKKSAENNVPILANCASNGIAACNVKNYNDFDQTKCNARSKSNIYSGEKMIFDDPDLDHFYRNYGHPKNWVPVLKEFPDLRLCFAGFGGTNTWQYLSEREWMDEESDEMPGKDWIEWIVELTRYKNVYADVSGLNIYDSFVRIALLAVLDFAKNEDENFKHLKYKLIFGSGWYTQFLGMIDVGYASYCREFKRLFEAIDESGELWERVSLINPWNFYALSDGKINKIHDALAKNINGTVDCDMLKKMKSVFDGSKKNVGLVKYIKDRNEEDPIPTMDPPT